MGFEFLPEDLEGALASWHTHPSNGANLSVPDYWFFKSWPSLVHFIVHREQVRCYTVHKQLVFNFNAKNDLSP